MYQGKSFRYIQPIVNFSQWDGDFKIRKLHDVRAMDEAVHRPFLGVAVFAPEVPLFDNSI